MAQALAERAESPRATAAGARRTVDERAQEDAGRAKRVCETALEMQREGL